MSAKANIQLLTVFFFPSLADSHSIAGGREEGHEVHNWGRGWGVGQMKSINGVGGWL